MAQDTGTKIEWAEPPVSDRRTTFWRTVADELRQHPKRWARVQTYKTRPSAASKVTRIRSGKMVGLGEGPWEARHAGSDDTGWDLYLRYMGESLDGDEPDDV